MALSYQDVKAIVEKIASDRLKNLLREYETGPHTHMDAVLVDLPKGHPDCPFCVLPKKS